MDLTTLDLVLERTLIACLADQVVARLRARRTTALVLFTGTGCGLGPAATALASLRQEGWALRPVFSPGACRMLGADQRLALGGSPAAETDPDPDELLAGCGAVLVATLSPNTAAKVAWGVRDSLASRLLARALERGLPVIAAWDGCCPDAPHRRAEGFRAPAAYGARLRANLEALASYGIQMVPAAALGLAAQSLQAPVERSLAAQSLQASVQLSPAAPPRSAAMYARPVAANLASLPGPACQPANLPANPPAAACQPASLPATCQSANLPAAACQPANLPTVAYQPANLPADAYQPASLPASTCQPTWRGPMRVFSRADAVLCGPGELRLDPQVRVTPWAADELRRRQVRLIRTPSLPASEMRESNPCT